VRVVVTGGSGQLGTLVLRRLLADRKIKQIVSLDLEPPAVAGRKLAARRADVRDPAIAAHFAGADAVIHLAFVVTAHLPRPEFDAINIGGTDNVLAAARQHNVARFLYSSSVAAYGVLPGHPEPILETSQRIHQPDFPYAACKFTVEEHLDAFEAAHPDIAITRFRPAILVGARMEHPLGDLLRRRLLPDSGAAPMPLVWDEDVADAIHLALRAASPVRGAFNLATRDPGGPPSARELARATGLRLLRVPPALRRATARLLPLLVRLGLTRGTDPAWLKQAGARLVMSGDKARAELGWKPRCETTIDVMQRYLAEVPGREDRRLTAFFAAVGLAARNLPPPAEARNMSLLVHLEMTGPGGGDRTLRLERGRLAVERAIPRPPQSVISLPARTLLDMIGGRTDFGTVQFTGALRVEGDPAASMLLGAMVAGFRTQTRASGVRGQIARAFGRWIAGPPNERNAA